MAGLPDGRRRHATLVNYRASPQPKLEGRFRINIETAIP